MSRRILFLGNDAPFFVATRLPLAQAAAAAGYDVHVATPPHPQTAAIRQSSLAWHAVTMSRSRLKIGQELRTLWEVARLYRRVRPDLVHHITAKPVLYGTIAARLSGVPRVVNGVTGLGYVHTSDATRLLRELASAVYRLGLAHRRMRVIFQNTDDRDVYLGRRWITAAQAVIIPGAGIDTGRFAPRPRSPRPAVLVVLACRMLRPKGIAEFVQAARRLKAEAAGVRMVLVGAPDPGNPASLSQAELDVWAREGAVEYWGHRDDMPAVLSEADIVCLPTYYREGVPRVLIEAAACGLPAVTTDTPGCRDIVIHEETGLLVAPRSVEDLAAAIRRLAGDRELRERLGRAAREHAVRHFSIERVLQSTLAVYAEMFQ